MKYFIALGVILLSAGLFGPVDAQTQTDPAAIVKSQENQSAGLAAAWLDSSDARTRAWGAYLAMRDQRRELLPQLIGLAEAYPVKSGPLSPTERDDRTAMLGVLDAIFQIDGRVPPEAAAKLYPEFPAQALIFLSRGGPAASSVLLDIFNDETGQTLAWLAAGDLLTKLKPPGFAAAALGGLTVHADVRVVDEGSGAAPGGGIGFSCASGGWPGPPPGWPSVGNYFLAGPGNTLLADGADPSFYIRIVGSATSLAAGDQFACGWLPARDVLREYFLARLARDPSGNPSVRSSVQTTIVWKNDAQYLGDLSAFIAQEEGLFDKLGKKLMDARLINAAEFASIRPSLQVQISDDRRENQSSLPVFQSNENNVKITN